MLTRLVFLLTVFVYGCASEPYWYKDPGFARCSTRAPVVVEVDQIQDGKFWEMIICFEDGHSIVMLDRFVPVAYRDCVRAHYERHLAGWDHKPITRSLSMDCGDGRMM